MNELVYITLFFLFIFPRLLVGGLWSNRRFWNYVRGRVSLSGRYSFSWGKGGLAQLQYSHHIKN